MASGPILFFPQPRVLNFRTRKLIMPVYEWLQHRPVMKEKNKDPQFMADRSIAEGKEVLEELVNVNGTGRAHKELSSEVADLLFFLISTVTNTYRLNPHDIHLPEMIENGHWIEIDSAVRQIQEISGNAVDSLTPQRDYLQAIGVWMMAARSPLFHESPEQTMRQVITKNNVHHQSKYYSGKDLAGNELSVEQQSAQFDRAVFVNRIVREVFGSKLMAQGINTIFDDLIFNFQISFQEMVQMVVARIKVQFPLFLNPEKLWYLNLLEADTSLAFHSIKYVKNSARTLH